MDGKKSTGKRIRHKYKLSKKSSRRIIIFFVVILVVFVFGIGILGVKDMGKNKASGSEKKAKSTVEFDDGRLKLLGSMEYEGPNFENSSMEEGIYTILEIQNISKSFLRNAFIKVKVNNSEEMSLVIDSLPAGETVMVIGQGYDGYFEQAVYEVISCKSSYEETVVCEQEGLTVLYEGGKILIDNQTSEDLSGTVFRYKGKTDNILIGGITYEAAIDNLPSGYTCNIDSQSLLAESVQIVEIK